MSIRRALRTCFGRYLPAVAVLALPALPGTLEAQAVVERLPVSEAWLGINVTVGQGQETNVLVTGVPDDGPAARAGIIVGDTLIRLDGSPSVVERLVELRTALKIGEDVRVSVRRNGAVRDLFVRADRRPSDEAFAPRVVIHLSGVDSLLWNLERQFDSTVAVVARAAAGSGGVRGEVRGAPTGRVSVSGAVPPVATQVRAGADASGRRPSVAPPRISLSTRLGDQDSLIRLIRDSLSQQVLILRERESTAPGAVTRILGPGSGVVTLGSPGRFLWGARIETLDAELGRYFGTSAGVLMLEVREETPAADAGLRGGDVIVAVDETQVRSASDLDTALRGVGARMLAIMREGRRIAVAIPR